jgi:radical SAM superfamily enzyme YgiQ (UPF0313 family)
MQDAAQKAVAWKGTEATIERRSAIFFSGWPMPHVALVPLSGFRVREQEMLDLGMSLPGLQQRARSIAQLPALGLLTLAGLTPAHWTQSYHEATSADDRLVEAILEKRPAVVAISALTASIDEAYRLSQRLRREKVKVVLGGLHATVCSREASTHCDSVVIGDGEPVWQQILADAEADTLHPLYRAAAPFDLGQSPIPRYDLLDNRSRPRWTLQTERGCPLACEFCGASRLLGRFREKPIANIRQELQAIMELSPHPIIELADDNTFVGERDPDELFDALANSGARYFTEVDWRIGERPELLCRLADSGCVQVLVGIESLIFRYPGMGPKHAEMQRILAAVTAIQQQGIAVIGCFIVGGDGETRASIDRLVRFIVDSPFADVQLTLQTPFPGTPLYRRLQQQRRLLPDRGWSCYTLFDVTYQPDLMTVRELETAFREVVQQVFSRSASEPRNRIRRSAWQHNRRLRRCNSEPSSST